MTAAIGLGLGSEDALARVHRSALVVFAIRILGAGLAYATQVLLARLMGRADYGVFATVWVWVAILGHGSLWGVSQSVCRFLPRHRALGDEDLARGFLRAGALFTAGSATLTALVGAGVLWSARDALDPGLVAPLGLALVVVPLFSVQDYLEGVARSFGWTALAIAPIYLLRQGLIAAAMLAAAASGAPADPWTAVAATLAAVVVSLLVQGAILARRIRRELPPGPVRHRLREWAGASLPMAGTDLATLALAYVDVLLVGLFLPAEDVAVYFAATRLLQFVIFAQYAASAASAQRFADAQARGDRTLLGALVHRTARLTALLTMVAGAGVALAAPELLSLFGPGFATSLPVLAILIAGVLAQGLCGPAEDVLTMLGAERTCALLSAACLVPAVALNLVLIPRYGVGGAAVAMAATGFLRAACLAAAAELRLGVRTHVFGGPGR